MIPFAAVCFVVSFAIGVVTAYVSMEWDRAARWKMFVIGLLASVNVQLAILRWLGAK